MRLKRSYLRELQSALTKEIGLPIHTCESLETDDKKGSCLICFLYRNPRFGLLFSKILLDKKIINEELIKEKYLSILDLVGEQRIFEIIESDLKTILNSEKVQCSFCYRKIPLFSRNSSVRCICGASPIKNEEFVEEVEDAVPVVTTRENRTDTLRALRDTIERLGVGQTENTTPINTLRYERYE